MLARRAASRHATPEQQVVVLLDNAPRHFAPALKAFCRTNRTVLLFNLPREPQANPIEFAWEFAKRPFRRWRDYRR